MLRKIQADMEENKRNMDDRLEKLEAQASGTSGAYMKTETVSETQADELRKEFQGLEISAGKEKQLSKFFGVDTSRLWPMKMAGISSTISRSTWL